MRREGKKSGAGQTFVKDGALAYKEKTSSRPTNNTIKNCPKCKGFLKYDLKQNKNKSFKQILLENDDNQKQSDRQILRKSINQYGLKGGQGNSKSFCRCCINVRNLSACKISQLGENKKGALKQTGRQLQAEILDAQNDDVFYDSESWDNFQKWDSFQSENENNENVVNKHQQSSQKLNLSNFIIQNEKSASNFGFVNSNVVSGGVVQQMNSENSDNGELDEWEVMSESSELSFEMVETY
eukprot:TRINITY_DN887_c0_g1_i1.p2 TRINITY_DN887_c0_g1~~TRINITY_DN887_c0_g1_i1.p2  ORF type:complete len:240 (+),score=38.37 TRINITY_DN887_c0_g1_i1:193-912(+)